MKDGRGCRQAASPIPGSRSLARSREDGRPFVSLGCRRGHCDLLRGGRCPQRPVFSRPPACRIATASLCHPGLRPAPGRICDEASARFTVIHPAPAFPSPVNPGGTGSSGFPWASHPVGQDPAAHARDVVQARTLPGLRPRHQPASLRRTHSQRATSRRTISQICSPVGLVRRSRPSPGFPNSGRPNEDRQVHEEGRFHRHSHTMPRSPQVASSCPSRLNATDHIHPQL